MLAKFASSASPFTAARKSAGNPHRSAIKANVSPDCTRYTFGPVPNWLGINNIFWG
jgi:hypothetical protein